MSVMTMCGMATAYYQLQPYHSIILTIPYDQWTYSSYPIHAVQRTYIYTDRQTDMNTWMTLRSCSLPFIVVRI